MQITPLIILGTGCAGLTAAIYAARANLKPLVIEGSQPGGQLTTTSDVENFPGFPEGIEGFELMDHLRKQASRFGANFQSDLIEKTDLASTNKQLCSASETYQAKAVILATGAAPRLLGIPGEATFFGGKGVSTCATCDGAFYQEQDVVVVGGGDSACEEALFLTRFCRRVTLIHRRDQFRASSIMAERVLKHDKIDILWNTVVEAILGEDKGEDSKVCAVRLKSVQTNQNQDLACQAVFIAIGHIPNTQPFQKDLKLDGQGYFITESGSQVRTAIPGVYVAGDCADPVYRQAITAAGMGCQAAIEAERWLAELG